MRSGLLREGTGPMRSGMDRADVCREVASRVRGVVVFCEAGEGWRDAIFRHERSKRYSLLIRNDRARSQARYDGCA